MMRRNLLFATLVALSCSAAASGQTRVVNGASYDSNQPLAPGAFASIFGESLAAGTFSARVGPDGQLPTSLGGVTVLVNGTPAMIYYAAPGQINFVVPSSAVSGPATVLVQTGSGSFEIQATVAKSGPGIFSINGMGMGEAAALHGWLWQRGPFSVTTDGQPTQISLYLSGLDLSTRPKVLVGGVEVEVTFYGNAPGYPGLQQINFKLPASLAGVGRVPVAVESNGNVSNVTFIVILPTTEMMANWVPGWLRGSIVRENMRFGRFVTAMAYIAPKRMALVVDAEEDVVRMLNIDSQATTATIPLPSDAGAMGIAADTDGSLAAVALTGKNSVALIDVGQRKVSSVVSVGYLPGDMAFWGADLLVTNAGSGTISIINTATAQVTGTLETGFGPASIDVAGNTAIVTNMQGGSLSLIDLTTKKVTTVALQTGTRPRDVALTADGKKAVITRALKSGFLIFDVATQKATEVDTADLGARGAGRIAISGNTAYITNQTTSSVSVVDLAAAKVVRTIVVDPGPRDVAVDAARNQLMVLCLGIGVVDIVDLGSSTVTGRVDAGLTKREITWSLPTVTSLSPTKGSIGSTFTLTITGMNLEAVKDLTFDFIGRMRRTDLEDSDIKVSNVQAKSDGTQVTATVQILKDAVEGQRMIRLVTDRGEARPPFAMTLFTVTK